MPNNFLDNGVDLEKIYVTNYAMVDQYAMTGSLWVWGRNDNGQLGTNDISNYSSPVQTVSATTNWKEINAPTRNYYAAGIKTDGTLWMWGQNNYGQLGNNSSGVNTSSPAQTVSTDTNWKQVSCGGFGYTGAIKTDGTLWMWGYNNQGQLGTNNRTFVSSPVQTVSATTNWKQVSCGFRHTAAIKTDGTLWLWGLNAYGELGTNNATSYSSPVQTVAAGTNWNQVKANTLCTFAIKTDGTLWSWGYNNYGQLGTNNITNYSSPVQTIAAGTNWKLIDCGSYHTAGIKTNGTLWTWGRNDIGQLGDNTIVNKSSPIQTVAGGTNWKQVSCGLLHTVAVKTDGTLWTWGSNGSYGDLGNNSAGGDYSSPIQTVAGGSNWKSCSAGSATSYAIYFYDAGNLYPSS